MNERTVVVAGTGQAGFQTATSLRDNGFEGRIVMVGEEPGLPYQRPPLSKGYLGDGMAERIQLRPASFFERKEIVVNSGVRIEAIDRTGRHLGLSNGRTIAYDDLVLALGARNRPLAVPGASLRNVLTLRTVTDADALRSALAACTGLIVVGGGFIGLEVAALARSQGVDVTVIEALGRLMSRAVSTFVAEDALAYHEQKGVRVRFGARVGRLFDDGAGAVAGVRLENGEVIGGDLVLLATGIVPNTELARKAGLRVANGICVDRHLRTEDPRIAAIGDCAAFPHGAGGDRVRLESVQNATDQARSLAASLAGTGTSYDSKPWFWSDQGDFRLRIAGLSAGADHCIRTVSGNGRGVVQCFADEQLVAVETINAPADFAAARKALSMGTPIDIATARRLDFDIRAYWEYVNSA